MNLFCNSWFSSPWSSNVPFRNWLLHSDSGWDKPGVGIQWFCHKKEINHLSLIWDEREKCLWLRWLRHKNIGYDGGITDNERQAFKPERITLPCWISTACLLCVCDILQLFTVSLVFSHCEGSAAAPFGVLASQLNSCYNAINPAITGNIALHNSLITHLQN